MDTGSRVLGAFLAAALAFACGQSAAQNYPARPIHFVVPYAPGGSDVFARIVGQALTERMGQPVVIDYKPGADSVIGSDYVAKSAPDGYTLLIGGSAMVYNAGLYPNLPFDSARDFIPVIKLVTAPLVVAVHPSVSAKSMKDLISMAKARPGGMFYASGYPPMYVATEFFKRREGLDIVHVPYKGSGPSVIAAVGGEVPMLVVSVAPVLAQLRAGKLRPLGVSGSRRSIFLPDVPTMTESGLDFEGGMWIAMLAPAGTPRAIVDRLYSESSAVLKLQSLKDRFAAVGYDTGGETEMPPDEFGAMFRAELAKWTKVIKELRLAP